MSATSKPTFAMYWAAGCGGCDIAVLNLGEGLLDVAEHLEVAFWPAAMDAKYDDVRAMPDGSLAVTLLSGGIRTSENADMARLLRRKSAILVAFGSCAGEGCIPGLANLSPLPRLFDASYGEGLTTVNPDGIRPAASWVAPEGGEVLELPRLEPLLRPVDRIVPVDYYVPGCPPETERIAEVVHAVIEALEGRAELPPRGSVLGAGHSSVCDECPRLRSEKHVERFTRIQSVASLDPDVCLLEQGIPCNGPATRDGCDARCPRAGAQCIGCYGPAEGVIDAGARLLSAFATVVAADEADGIDRILDGIVDPVGQAYRFGLAASLLGGSRTAVAGARDGVEGEFAAPAAGRDVDRDPVASVAGVVA